jgi:hypothetical protein
MKNIHQLRALLVYLCLGAPLAASCAHESTPELEGSAGGSKASAGSKSTAGNSAAGNATVAGSNGNAQGGTSAKGGNANGGTSAPDPEAGAPSTSGGTTGGGSGGTTGGGGGGSVPPDVLMRASAVVYYETSHATASDKTIQMKLHIKNQSPDPLPMGSVSIRYWFTAEVAPTLHQYYVAQQLTLPKAELVSMDDETHVLMTFGGGSITMGQDINFSEVQLDISSNTTAFDQSDDFSWDATAATSKPNPKITLYLDDALIWGCEPSGKCFDDAAGGVGGQGAGGAPGGAAGEPASGAAAGQTGLGGVGAGGAP